MRGVIDERQVHFQLESGGRASSVVRSTRIPQFDGLRFIKTSLFYNPLTADTAPLYIFGPLSSTIWLFCELSRS